MAVYGIQVLEGAAWVAIGAAITAYIADVGAFTGADHDKKGLFEIADGGTLFLDEIAEMSLTLQAKLLRVLQEGEIRPVGGSKTVSVDVRVVSATNRDLAEDVRQGRFRQDLYYRLSTMTLHVPALRARPMDIPFISQQVLDKAKLALGKPVKGFTQEAMDCLTAYRWPGNVRELQNEINRMLALSDSDWLGAEYLNGRVVQAASVEEEPELRMLSGIAGSLKDRLEMLEARVLKEAMVRAPGQPDYPGVRRTARTTLQPGRRSPGNPQPRRWQLHPRRGSPG